MKRRDAIKNVMIITAAGCFLASCGDKSSRSFRNISLTGTQEKMLSALAESIIPKTDFPGAIDLRANEFVVMMADDCMNPEDQKKFMAGMKAFEAVCASRGNKFVDCTPSQRNEILALMEKKKDTPDEAARFYQTVKHYTVQCFTSSEAYLLQVRNYKMLPGHFHGTVAVAQA